MPKAIVTTKGGATVTVEGTQGEVAELLRLLDGAERTKEPSRAARSRPNPKPTPTGLISDLIAGGFFREPKELGAVKTALEEQGHFYPVTTLSPLMLRLVRKRELRRIRERKRWLYVG